jgi:CRP-like cAMP-binding protein
LEQIGTGNRLLSALSDAAIEKISPHLNRVWLEPGSVLCSTEQVPVYAHFPESGIIAVSTPGTEGRLCCVGLYGFEGCGSLAPILGAPTSSTYEVVEMSGYALRVPTDVLLQAFATLPEVRSLMLRYVHVFMMQLANTVLANSARIEQRLARWLLMYQDRIRGISLAVTHQALSSILGVRRAGVTEAIHVLEGRKMIRSQRGLINILDRPRLETMTAGSYGGPEAEYRRLI